MVIHFGLPSKLPMVYRRTVSASEAVCCTPLTCASVQASRSVSTSVSLVRHWSAGVFTITANTSLEMLYFEVMVALSRL